MENRISIGITRIAVVYEFLALMVAFAIILVPGFYIKYSEINFLNVYYTMVILGLLSILLYLVGQGLTGQKKAALSSCIFLSIVFGTWFTLNISASIVFQLKDKLIGIPALISLASNLLFLLFSAYSIYYLTRPEVKMQFK